MTAHSTWESSPQHHLLRQFTVPTAHNTWGSPWSSHEPDEDEMVVVVVPRHVAEAMGLQGHPISTTRRREVALSGHPCDNPFDVECIMALDDDEPVTTPPIPLPFLVTEAPYHVPASGWHPREKHGLLSTRQLCSDVRLRTRAEPFTPIPLLTTGTVDSWRWPGLAPPSLKQVERPFCRSRSRRTGHTAAFLDPAERVS